MAQIAGDCNYTAWFRVTTIHVECFMETKELSCGMYLEKERARFESYDENLYEILYMCVCAKINFPSLELIFYYSSLKFSIEPLKIQLFNKSFVIRYVLELSLFHWRYYDTI